MNGTDYSANPTSLGMTGMPHTGRISSDVTRQMVPPTGMLTMRPLSMRPLRQLGLAAIVAASWLLPAPADAGSSAPATMQTDASNAKLPPAQINLAIPPGFVDLRKYGAVCDGATNVESAVTAALAAGFKQVYLPAGCRYQPTVAANQTPSDLSIVGGNPTAVIAVADRATDNLSIGPRGRLQNVGVIDSTCDSQVPPTATQKTCPVLDASNWSDSAQTSTWWPYELQHYVGATLTFPDGTVSVTDKPGIASIVNGTGADAFYAQANASGAAGVRAVSSAADAIGLYVLPGLGDPTPSNPHTGVWIKDIGTGGQGLSNSSLYIDRANPSGNPPVAATITDADSGATANTSDFLDLNATSQTGGSLVNFFHATTAFTGNVLQASMAAGSGSFTGNFLRLINNSTVRFNVNSTGGLQSTVFLVQKTTNYTITENDTGKLFENASAAGEVDFTLPASASISGLRYCFMVAAAQTLKVIAPGTGKIAIGTSNSAAGGNVTDNALYGSLCLVNLNAAQWVAQDHEGTWTVN